MQKGLASTVKSNSCEHCVETIYHQGTTLTFAATCPVGLVRFNFHLPYSNFHLPLKNCI